MHVWKVQHLDLGGIWVTQLWNVFHTKMHQTSSYLSIIWRCTNLQWLRITPVRYKIVFHCPACISYTFYFHFKYYELQIGKLTKQCKNVRRPKNRFIKNYHKLSSWTVKEIHGVETWIHLWVAFFLSDGYYWGLSLFQRLIHQSAHFRNGQDWSKSDCF